MEKTSPFRRWLPFGIGFLSALFVDQTTKYIVINNLQLGESWHVIPQISSFIRVTRSFNTGAAFGIFPMGSDIFLILAFAAVCVFIFTYPQLPVEARWSRYGIALICGGALSNAIDRIQYDHVVDYVHVQLTPTFANISNFADHAIVVGMLILVIEQMILDYRAAQAEKNLSVSTEDPGTEVVVPRQYVQPEREPQHEGHHSSTL